MPQQPKITGDAEVDSWSLQVTQELNDTVGATGGGGSDTQGVPIVAELPNEMGTIGELVSLTTGDGDYGADVYRRIANNEEDADWDLVGRADAPAPVVFPAPATLTDRITYRLGFTAGMAGTTSPGRGTVVGFSSGNNLIGFDFGNLTGTTNMPAVGTPADTSANTYVGSNIADIPAGGQVDFSSINLSLPTAAQWADLRGATAGAATNLSWAFWTGDGDAGRGTQFGFRIPHPALITEANLISPASWPARFPYAPIAAAAGSIRVRIVGIDDPTYIVTINYTPNTPTTDLPWNTYNSDNTVAHVQSNRGSREVTPSGTTGNITFSPNRAHRPFVNGHRYDVFITMNSTFDAAGHNFVAPMLAENRQGNGSLDPSFAGATVTPATNNLVFRRSGDVVHWGARLRMDNFSGDQPLQLNGLPYNVSSNNLSETFTVRGESGLIITGSERDIRGEYNLGTSTFSIVAISDVGARRTVRIQDLNNRTLDMNGWYITEDP